MFLSIPEASHFPYLLPGAVSVLTPLGQCLLVKVSEEEKPHTGGSSLSFRVLVTKLQQVNLQIKSNMEI